MPSRMGRFRQLFQRLVLLAAWCSSLPRAPRLRTDPSQPLTRPAHFPSRSTTCSGRCFGSPLGSLSLVEGGILAALFLFRDKDGAQEPKQIHGSPKLEVLWTVIPALILAGIAVPTTAAVFELTGCAPDAIEIEVTGHQWWFEYHYPDAGFDTANVMVIPTGQEICARMTSDDVLHNFWIPAPERQALFGPGTDHRVAAPGPMCQANIGDTARSFAGCRIRSCEPA